MLGPLYFLSKIFDEIIFSKNTLGEFPNKYLENNRNDFSTL